MTETTTNELTALNKWTRWKDDQLNLSLNLDAQNPFLERKLWRRRTMYRGWSEEPIIFAPSDRAAITRSHFGYRVLNTPDLGIIDIDFNVDYDLRSQELEALKQLEDWCADHPRQLFRVYRSAGGFRFLRMDAPTPLDEEYDKLSILVGGDEVYRYMCREEQGCFRVRISPKPHRIAANWSWSFFDKYGSDLTEEQIAEYEERAKKYKTCTFVQMVGKGDINMELAKLVELHDTECRVYENVPVEALHYPADGHAFKDIDGLEFNRRYRPDGMASDLLWSALDGNVKQLLRDLDDPEKAEAVRAAHEHYTTIEERWSEQQVYPGLISPTRLGPAFSWIIGMSGVNFPRGTGKSPGDGMGRRSDL